MVLVFLQDWRAMILPMIDVPVSLIGTFAVMAVLGFSLNNISLFGLVLAIGIVVDDAIVVLENIERLIATGLDVRTATIKAMEEVTGPIIAVALVLCAVFVPCAFVSGITGQFFRQFAVTIAVSTVISAINAMTMTPSRAVLIFKADAAGQRPCHPPRGTALVDLGVCRRTAHRWYLVAFSGPRRWRVTDGEMAPRGRVYWKWVVFFLPGAVLGAGCRLVHDRPFQRRARLALSAASIAASIG